MLYDTYSLSSRDEATTDMDDIAIAADAIQSCMTSPKGKKMSAATGLPTIKVVHSDCNKLHTNTEHIVFLKRSITSRRSF